jgi:hypothetical protein
MGMIAVTIGLCAGLAGAQPVPDRPPLIDERAEQAISKGLAFLARTQIRNGSWRSGTRYGSYPVAMTSLAGMALLGGGNTPVEGEYAANVRRAVDYLLGCTTSTGLISQPGEEQRAMYGHGFAMLFLAEAYGMEQDITRQKRIKRALTEAVELTGRAQSNWGGWYYGPNDRSDEGSVTITQVQGLRAARNAGIKVPSKIIDKAVAYIEKSANADGGIRYTARGRGSSLPPITAAAVAVLYNAGDYDNPIAVKALEYMEKRMQGRPVRALGSGHKFYTMLYLSQAMFQAGDKKWNDYFPEIRDDLVKTQAADGSWNGDGVGTTYGTAIAITTLTLPYRYVPIYQR